MFVAQRRERTNEGEKNLLWMRAQSNFSFFTFSFRLFLAEAGRLLTIHTANDDVRKHQQTFSREEGKQPINHVFLPTYAERQSILSCRSRTRLFGNSTKKRPAEGKSDAKSKIWQRGLFSMETRSCLVFLFWWLMRKTKHGALQGIANTLCTQGRKKKAST